MAVVGSAEVIVRAITTQVKKDIQKAFADARPVIAKEGEEAGKEYAQSFGRSLNTHMTNEARTAVRNVNNVVGNDLQKGLSRAGQAAARNTGRAMENELTGSGRRGGRGFISGFADAIASDIPRAANLLFTVSSAFDLMAPSIALVIGMVSTLVSGLFAMGAAASQAAGAIAVLPGLLGAAAQAFGAIKLGMGGVGEAIKAGAKAQTAASSAAAGSARSSGVAAAAARRLQKAQDELTAAQKEARAAQKALNDAQNAAKAGAEEQAQAEARLAAAQQQRSQVLADPNASAQQGADVQKSVDDAKQASNEIARSREAAQKRVDAAQERSNAAAKRLAAAEAARNRAQKANQAGGISSPAIKAAQAYQDALSRLTPEARAFVAEVLKMRAAFKEVGDAIARELFPPLTKALQLLGDSSFFDILKRNLSTTGGIIGNIGLEFVKAFTTKTNMQRFSDYLAGNNDILDTLITKTKDGTTPMTSLTNVILKLGLAIQPVTKRFAEWAGSMITAFDASHSVGDMAGSFNRAGNAAAQLGRIFGNLFGIIGALGKAAMPAGKGLTSSFEEATGKLEAFLKTPETQKDLREYFSGVADNMRSIGNLINAIGKEFLALGDNEGISTFAEGLIPVVEVIGDIGDKITTGDIGKSLADLALSVADLINSFTQTGQLEVFIDSFSAIVKVVAWLTRTLLDFPGAGAVLAFLAAFRAGLFALKLAGFTKTADKLKNALGQVVLKLLKLAAAPFKKIAGGLKSAFKRNKGGGGSDDDPVPDTKDDDERARGQGYSIGESLSEGIAEGIRLNAKLVDDALDDLFLKLHNNFTVAVQTFGNSMGEDIVEGLALGIRTNISKAAMAATDLGDEVIDALKLRLGIHSPSTVMHSAGDDTADGFILGIRENRAQAFRAGADLADAAADGARTGRVQATAAGAGSVSAAAAPGADKGVAAVSSKLGEADKKTGRFRGSIGKLGGAFKGLGVASMALVGGPFGALMLAIPLLIAGFTALYKKSPEFRKFVDGIVKAVKPVVEAIGKFLVGALNKFFGWINDHMPQIKAVFSSVFGAIGSFISNVVVPIFNNVLIPVFKVLWTTIKLHFNFIKGIFENVLFPVFRALWSIAKSVFGAIRSAVGGMKNAIGAAFRAVGAVWDKVLHPVFKAIRRVASSVFGAVKGFINGMKNAFGKAVDVMGKAKDALVGVFNGVKSAAKKPIKWVIDTVWNKGVVGLVDKIPGVSAKGWKVNTKGWATGGWTGPGGKYQPAGIVHADEFVVKKQSRRTLEKLHPGLLDYINRLGRLPGSIGNALGYSSGGRVTTGGSRQHSRKKYPWASWAGDFPYTHIGSPVWAWKDGKVWATHRWNVSYGNHIRMKHKDGTESLYAHLSKILVHAKQKIKQGQKIGEVGWSGNVKPKSPAGAHLHFEAVGGGGPGSKGGGGIKGFFSGLAKKSLKLGGKTIDWAGDIVKGTVKWTAEKAKAAWSAGKDFITFLKNLPGRIASNMGSGWGKAFSGLPKGAANKTVDKINSIVPSQLPLFPIGHPFKGVNFRAQGGRVRKGSPYVVGELRPELFIPDSNGMIMPNLSRLTSNNAIADILKALANNSGNTSNVTTTTQNDNGARTLNVNITNPQPERSSQSVAKAVRSKAIAHGWSV